MAATPRPLLQTEPWDASRKTGLHRQTGIVPQRSFLRCPGHVRPIRLALSFRGSPTSRGISLAQGRLQRSVELPDSAVVATVRSLHGGLEPRANGSLYPSKYPPLFAAKYRQRCRELDSELRRQLRRSLHLNLNSNLCLNLNPALLSPLFQSFFETLFQQLSASSLDSLFVWKYRRL